MLGKGWTRKAFGQRIGHIFCGPDMPSALPISGIFAHHNTRGIIFPYFCGADLSEIETPQQRSQINGFLARL
jgi:hypothetical protein